MLNDQSSKYSDSSCLRRILLKAFPSVNEGGGQLETDVPGRPSISILKEMPIRLNTVRNARSSGAPFMPGLNAVKNKKKKRKRRRNRLAVHKICDQRVICCVCRQRCFSAQHVLIRRSYNPLPVANLNICLERPPQVRSGRSPVMKSVVRYVLMVE